jgi:diacylglycerol kinase (ATP)
MIVAFPAVSHPAPEHRPPMAVSSLFVIHNPVAGRGKGAQAWRRIEPQLVRSGVRYEAARTEAPRHAETLAERAAQDGWDAVVAVGGDGTVQQAAAGLLRAAGGEPTLPLGIIGVGSGNDFIKMINGHRRRPADAVEHLLTAEPKRFDVGRIGNRYFTNGVGAGFDAQVAIQASRIRRLRGMALYGWALLRVLRNLRAPRIQLTLDGNLVLDRKLTLVTVGNGACHGGGFWICPDARPDDGLFDVCIADELSRARLLQVIPRVMRGTHVRLPEVEILRARHVLIRSPDAFPVHADGEIFSEATHELELEVLPGRLTVLT